jgi:hypothetical protein
MIQNLLSLTLGEDDLAGIDNALSILETHFAALPELSADDMRSLNKMGGKSEPLCRQTLTLLAQTTQSLPPSFDLAEARNDLASLDQLRPRFHRLRALMGKADGAETALGSDIINAALEGYALLKVSGKGAALETLREAMSARRGNRAAKPAAPATGG